MKKLVGIVLTSLALGGTVLGAGAVVDSELDYERGKVVYEMEIENDGYEYEYKVDAVTGAILESEKEVDDDVREKKPVEKAEVKSEVKADTSATEDIGKEQAKAIALKHAGVSEEQAVWEDVERDYDDGRLEYSVEFRVGNKEYDYEIDGVTSKILEYDIDVDDDDDRWDD